MSKNQFSFNSKIMFEIAIQQSCLTHLDIRECFIGEVLFEALAVGLAKSKITTLLASYNLAQDKPMEMLAASL